MRQTILGMLAAATMVVAGAAPAAACGGLFDCGQNYAPVYSGCNSCGSSYERLPDPVQQYYFVNQGPTYSGPGNFAPYPTYQESAVSGWDAYRRNPYYYGYNGGSYANATNHYYDGAPAVGGPAIYTYRPHHYYRPWSHYGYRYGGYRPHYAPAPRYGYAPRYALPPRHYHSMRYGYQGVPHRYGYREHVLRRYY